MKLSKSKLALAKVINENGGWPDEVNYAVQQGGGEVWTSRHKPIWIVGGFRFSIDYCFHIANCKLINNRHQAILSREEYYQAYPKDDADGISLSELMSRKSKAVKADADGWIEWSGVECPVEAGTIVDVRYRDGRENFHVKAMSYDSTGSIKSLSATCWGSINSGSDIVAYRLHNPEVKPEFCESVTRSIPEPESKPTIERLAQDYRNTKEYAARLQKDADEAKDKSEAIKELLIKSGAEIGIVISIGKAGDEIEYKIGDKWFLVSDLKSAGWTDEQLSDYPSR